MRAVLALALASSATAFKSGSAYKYKSRVLQGLADLIPEDGPDPGPIPTFDDGGDDDTFVCDAPAGCPCLSDALDTFTDDDITMQPQLYSCADNAACRKRPKYLADIVYPLRGDLEFIPIDVDMNGATSLDGFSLKVEGTGVATERTELKYDNATDTATVGARLKFADSTGIRTRNFAYVLIDDSGTCPDSSIDKRADVYPKWMPFIPILSLLAMCLLTQDVFISMSFGIWVGRWMIERDAWIGLLRFLDTDLPEGLAEMAMVILFAWLLGGIIGAANRSGGMAALGPLVIGYIKDSFLSQLITFFFGFLIFMDDYGNTLIVGNTIRPITDTMRLSREKLSFLVDCTSAPIASIVSTWVSFELALINQAIKSIGYDSESAYTLFLNSIGKSFYAWFMLSMVLGSILVQRDWGPMYRAELRARRGVAVFDDMGGSEDDIDEHHEDLEMTVKPKRGIPHRAMNAILPFAGIIMAFLPLLFYSGARQAKTAGNENTGWDASARRIIGNADAYGTLLWLGGFGLMFQIVLYAVQYSKEWGGMLLTPSETISGALEGTKDLIECTVVLMMASAIGKISQMMMLPDAVVDLIGDSIPGKALPVVVFITSAVIALSTGSSWATMTIVFPIAIPLANNASGGSLTIRLENVIGAILGGAVWGDHCSPISDTTVLSAASCRVKTIDHVKTQLPYAFLAGSCAAVFGYLLNGYGVPHELLVLGAFAGMPWVFYAVSMIPGWGGPTPIYDPEHDKVVGEGFYGAMSSLKRNCACGKRGDDAPLKKSTIDDDGVTVETGLRSPSPGPSASTKIKVTPGIDETDL